LGGCILFAEGKLSIEGILISWEEQIDQDSVCSNISHTEIVL
jgi:hypothetical protein